ncbi:MAG TPA: site-specific integrase [Bacteroides sp.]|nr:site-specific integrase [Bacteroides sp.]
MKRPTIRVSFAIRRGRTLKNGEATILWRITVNGEREELTTNRTIHPDNWDRDKGKSKGYSHQADRLNEYLKKKELKVFDAEMELDRQGIPVNARNIKDYLQGNTKVSSGILELFADHNKKFYERVGIDRSKATAERYETGLSHIREYIQREYKSKDMPLQSIKHEFIEGFYHFLLTQRKCSNNSTIKYLRNFRKVIRIALNNEWLHSDPFRNTSYRLEPVNRTFLTDIELGLIWRKDFGNQSLERIRDIFVFCCYTGLAFSDVKRLKKENLVQGIEGDMWIRIQRQKTKQPSEIFLMDIPRGIIQKYSDHPDCIIKDVVLPVPSNQKMNMYLKIIMDLSGINKKITTHTGRHTFGTTVTLNHGVPIEVVAKQMGHADIRTTAIYARVLPNSISREMKKVQEDLNSSNSNLKIS